MKRIPWFLILFLFLYGGGAGASDKQGILLVDRFTAGVTTEGLPMGWALEKTPGPKSAIAVKKENGFNFLQLQSADDTFGIKKDIPFEIEKFPYLSWKWRAREIPPQGDIRQRDTDDQAGQLYIVFPKFPTMINSRSVGYIWDSNAPVGLMGASTAYGKAKYVVLESGSGKLNQWIPESRNVYQDYRKLFEEQPPKVGAVLIYINTQHTHGKAVMDYADIFFSASPPPPASKP